MKLETLDHFKLDVKYHRGVNNKLVIFAHGMTVNKDDEGIFVRADRKLQSLGFSTILFDFRAHGKSQGNSVADFTISNELLDLKTVIDFSKDEGYRWIGLAGASFGGGISALFAGQKPDLIDKLFLANPALNYDKCFLNPTTPWAKQYFKPALDSLNKNGYVIIGSHEFKVGRRLFEEMNSYFPDKALDNYHNPLLIVHGDRDSKVGFADTYDSFRSLASRKKKFIKIAGSEHGFHEEPFETRVVELIVDFFEGSDKS